MARLPLNHPDRLVLAAEVHARPPEPVESPARASYLALQIDPAQRAAEHAHLSALCAQHGVAAPGAEATHFSTRLGALRFKWERHGEFSGYTFIAADVSVPAFAQTALDAVPQDWLQGIPGATMVAAHAQVLPMAQGHVPDLAALQGDFSGNVLVGAEVGDGAGLAFTDFRIHADGCARFAVFNRHFTPAQAGRTLQRLFEIEVYRMMALLALPIARRLAPRLQVIEAALAALTEGIARDGGDDEALLQELTRLAAEVESALAASQFRFGACAAYHELVTTRIAELREQRLAGMQTLAEFMARRFAPAVATCASTLTRLHRLSDRVAQASALLSTRVDIARERQNQALLGSMDRRAKLQLRLQQTVEGLSVAAIVYYVAGVVGYLSKGLKAGGWHVEPDLVVGLAIPLVALMVAWEVRRARTHIAQADDEGQRNPGGTPVREDDKRS